MSDPFLDDEKSPHSSVASEYYDIALSTGVTYRIAAGERDIKQGEIVYTATPGARSDIVVPQLDANGGKALELTLPVNHPVVKRWFVLGAPPRQTKVTAWRRQERSGLVEQLWYGLATSISANGNIAKLLIPAHSVDTTQRSLPTVTAGRNCPHILYDTQCRVDRVSFKVATTAIRVSGRTVHVDLGGIDKNGDWSENGELLHVATGERMTIAKQTDTAPGVEGFADLDMQLPIVELRVGDAIEIYAGCKKSVAICLAKFNNVPNYGGSPRAPTSNPFAYYTRLL